MNCHDEPRKRKTRINHGFYWALLGLTIASGCAAPPSVTPLMRAADLALGNEAQLLQADQAREAQWIQQARGALDAGFAADLDRTPQPDKVWITDAARAYAAAREELLAHEKSVQQQLQQRAENLRTASEAQRRAIALLERQNDLITQSLGFDFWKLSLNTTTTQPAH